MKKLLIVLAVIALGLNLNAQKLSLLQPVTADIFGEDGAKAGTGVWIPRINAGVSFISLTPTFNELGEFNGFASQPLSKLALGMSYAHYTQSEDKAICNYSVSGLLLLPTTGETNVALGITGSLFNITGGVGYTLQKGPAKGNIFALFGVQFLL
jgi:hypothetical protein